MYFERFKQKKVKYLVWTLTINLNLFKPYIAAAE